MASLLHPFSGIEMIGAEVVLGLDSGTHTGFAALTQTGQLVDYGARDFSKLLRFERWVAMRDWLGKKLDFLKPKLVVIEGYGYGNVYSLATLVEFGTVLRLTMLDHGIPFVEIPPSQLKKFVGSGNAKKDEIRLAVFKKWEFEHKSNDTVDAYLAARIGMAILQWASVNEAQKAILYKCESVKRFLKG